MMRFKTLALAAAPFAAAAILVPQAPVTAQAAPPRCRHRSHPRAKPSQTWSKMLANGIFWGGFEVNSAHY
jgi:hypothetical protein